MSSRYELFCHLYVLQVFFLSDLPIHSFFFLIFLPFTFLFLFHSFNNIYFE